MPCSGTLNVGSGSAPTSLMPVQNKPQRRARAVSAQRSRYKPSSEGGYTCYQTVVAGRPVVVRRNALPAHRKDPLAIENT